MGLFVVNGFNSIVAVKEYRFVTLNCDGVILATYHVLGVLVYMSATHIIIYCVASSRAAGGAPHAI